MEYLNSVVVWDILIFGTLGYQILFFCSLNIILMAIWCEYAIAECPIHLSIYGIDLKKVFDPSLKYLWRPPTWQNY